MIYNLMAICRSATVLILIVLLFPLPVNPASPQKLLIKTVQQSHEIKVDVAVTDEQHKQGLSGRTDMPDNYGMLFFFSSPKIVFMWMKDTPIPLDMVFIRADGIISSIKKNAEPNSEKLIPSHIPVAAVLEVKAGTVDKLGIKIGNKIIHNYFPEF